VNLLWLLTLTNISFAFIPVSLILLLLLLLSVMLCFTDDMDYWPRYVFYTLT